MKYKAPGKIVEVNNHKMHVFSFGQGEKTLVFMAGHGTSCPTLNFKPLWSILSKKNRIVVVERAGYGWSETTNSSRDIDTILEETRKALKLSHLDEPFILLPHSLAGLEAIYWAQKYPDEIKAIIGLDPAIPEAYDILKIPSAAIINTIGFLARKGVHKPFVKVICKKDVAVQSGYLTEAEIETYINRVKEKTFTSDMLNEVKYIRQNANKIKRGKVPINTPIYFFISKENEKVIANWSKLLINYLIVFKKSMFMQLECGHYVHACKPKEIAKEIEIFISGLI